MIGDRLVIVANDDERGDNVGPSGGKSGNEIVAAVAGPGIRADAKARFNAGADIGSWKSKIGSEGTTLRIRMIAMAVIELNVKALDETCTQVTCLSSSL